MWSITFERVRPSSRIFASMGASIVSRCAASAPGRASERAARPSARIMRMLIRSPDGSRRGRRPHAGCRRTGILPAHPFHATNMGTEQYHEPANELSDKTRTFARMITSLIEEAEAIGWYEQRISLEKDREALAIMKNAQHEEMKHFGMDLEFLLRRKPEWRETLRGILFTDGDIVEHGDEAEEASEKLADQ